LAYVTPKGAEEKLAILPDIKILILYGVSVLFGIFQRIEIKFSQPHFQPNFSDETTSVAKGIIIN
jgi:hypothetical protein